MHDSQPHLVPVMSIPEVSLDKAWRLLEDDPTSVLIDVRTRAEWNFVGIPVLDGIGKQPRFVEWTRYPTGAQNEQFVAEAAEGLERDQPLLLLCRSGARSLAAAQVLNAAGFTTTYNVVAGFEGPLDADGHRHGGWKEALPWRQG